MAAFISEKNDIPNLRHIHLPFKEDLVLKIGRADDNNIKLQNSSFISRYHAKLMFLEGDWYIVDCKSSNGVYVNDKKIEANKETLLKDGDSIIFDYQLNKTPRYSFKFQNEREDDPLDQALFKKPKLSRLIPPDRECSTGCNEEDIEELDYGSCLKRKHRQAEKNTKHEPSENDIKKEEEIEKLKKLLEEKEQLLKLKEEENAQIAIQKLKEREVQFEEEKKLLLEEMREEKQKTGQAVAEIQREYEEKIKKQEETFNNEKKEIVNKKTETEEELKRTILETQEKLQSEKDIFQKTLQEQIESTSKMYEKEKEELKAEQTKVRKELEEVTKKMNSQNSSLDNKDKMINLLEEELICSICSELFICPMSLQCTHTFCALCIHQWIRRKNECPQCRVPITSKANSLAMQNYIDKAVSLLSPEMRERRRRLLIERREETEKFNRQYAGRGRTRANARNTVVYIGPRPAITQEVVEIRPRPATRTTQFIDLTQTPAPRFALRRGRTRGGDPRN